MGKVRDRSQLDRRSGAAVAAAAVARPDGAMAHRDLLGRRDGGAVRRVATAATAAFAGAGGRPFRPRLAGAALARTRAARVAAAHAWLQSDGAGSRAHRERSRGHA